MPRAEGGTAAPIGQLLEQLRGDWPAATSVRPLAIASGGGLSPPAMAGGCGRRRVVVRGGVGAERGGAGSNGRSVAPRLRAALPGHPAAVGAAREHRRFQCQREAGAEGSAAR